MDSEHDARVRVLEEEVESLRKKLEHGRQTVMVAELKAVRQTATVLELLRLLLSPSACVLWIVLLGGDAFWAGLLKWITTGANMEMMRLLFSAQFLAFIAVIFIGPSAFRAFLRRVRLVLPSVGGDGGEQSPGTPAHPARESLPVVEGR